MRITPSGSIGIGTTSPDTNHQVTIEGNGRIPLYLHSPSGSTGQDAEYQIGLHNQDDNKLQPMFL